MSDLKFLPEEIGTGVYCLDQDGQIWLRTPHAGWLRCQWIVGESVNGRVFRNKLIQQQLSERDSVTSPSEPGR